MIEYRKAVENDRASIEALFIEMLQTIYHTDDVEGYEEGYLNRYFSDHEDEVIVAVDNGQVVAFLSVQVFRGDNYIYLDDLSVTARYRDQGIGSCLIKSAEDYAKVIGISAIVFHVETSNERAHKAMMGEYIIYYRGKIVGGIYDDRFLVKNVKAAIDKMPDADLELPYEGAKEMLLVDDVDNKEFLKDLFEAMYDELPAPKKKK